MNSRRHARTSEHEEAAADLKKFDTSIRGTALRLCKLGFAVHWLRLRSKAPVEAGWPDLPVKTAEELMRTHQPAFNLGFRAGAPSIVDGLALVVLDVDIKHPDFAEEAYAAAKSLMGGNFRPTVISGSGVGRHQFLRVPLEKAPNKAALTLRSADVAVLNDEPRIVRLGTPKSKPVWTIELLSTGKNVVLPPSIRPDTGRQYEWADAAFVS